MQQDIQYKNVPNFPGYRVGNDGTVWTCKKHIKLTNEWKRLCLWKSKSGHLVVNLYKNNKQNLIYVHRLVLECFIGSCPENMECCHNDGNPSNNTLENLRWDTPKNNCLDKVKHGTSHIGKKFGRRLKTSGEKSPVSKLKEKEVLEIRQLYESGIEQKVIAKQYNICNANVSAIVTRRSWSHI